MDPEDIIMEDTDSSNETGDEQHAGSTRALQGIESIVLSFLSQLLDASTSDSNDDSDANHNHKKLTAQQRREKSKIELRLVDRTKEPLIDDDNGDVIPRMKTLRYPRKSAGSSCRSLATLLRTLDLMHEAIVDGVPMTKRDMFYKDVKLFKTQRTVDTLVDDLAATLELDRADLNIRASSKGLICGSGLTINLISGETIQGTDTEGTLIPVGEDIESFGFDEDVDWVLIVEKEAVFQSLCRLKITDREDMPGRGLVITGKGYPDVATQHLVKTLADCLPERIPIMALVDADPYGLDILSVYKYGSRAMSHENERLAAGRVKWIGIWNSEFSRLGIDKDKLLQIGKADEKKAYAMLNRPLNMLPKKWKKELMHMLFTRRKAEIEILSTLTFSDRYNNISVCDNTAEDKQDPVDNNNNARMNAVYGGNGHLIQEKDDDNVSVPMDNCVFTRSYSLASSSRNLENQDKKEKEKKGVSDMTRIQPRPSRNGLVWYLQRKISRLVDKEKSS